MMFRIDTEGVFHWFRPADEFAPSLPGGMLVGRSIYDLFPDNAARLMGRIHHMLETGRSVHFDLDGIGAGGERFLEATISGIDQTNVLVMVRDVSERRQVQSQLEHSIRSKDNLVASVSHELRTPLTTIVGLATELRHHDRDFAGSERQEFIRMIADQATEMADLIDDLLVAARAEGGEIMVDPRMIDVPAEVLSVLDSWTGEPPEVHCDPGSKAYADPFRVRQILRNLLSNAERYGEVPVRISVEQLNNDSVEILVQDCGVGLEEDQWETIFDPYHRAHDRKGVPASVGLGLTVSRRLAEALEGSLEYLVKGGLSTFRLLLPASADRSSAA